MEYLAPTLLEDAYRALAFDDARCLAGGQSLVAMMNLGLVAPARLVSLRRIAALRGITATSEGGLRIGAMTTHAEIAALSAQGTEAAPGDALAAGPALLAQAASVIAYPAIRAWGTIGGSVAHADPAADYPVALVAAEAAIEVGSAAGSRRIAARDFFRGVFESALAAGEIVIAIHVPAGPTGARAKYEKLSVVAGDFAILSVAAIVARTAQIAIGGCGPVPLFASGLETADDALLAAGRRLAAASDPPDDHRTSPAYRRRVLPELLRRAVRAARAEREIR
ncbi:MAG: FAD binding domain-containing protein [Betaproteobacteria bacterium]